MIASLNIIIITLLLILSTNIGLSWKFPIPRYNPNKHFNYAEKYVNKNHQFHQYKSLKDKSKLYFSHYTGAENYDLTENEEEDLVNSMSLELYDLLRGDNEYLSIAEFLEWDDIKEVLDRDTVDIPTLNAIFDEIGIKDHVITYNQFIEVVELINQIEISLEFDELEDEMIEDDDKINNNDNSNNDNNNDIGDSKYNWIKNSFL